MPPRRNKTLGINDKDYTEKQIGSDDFRRNWVSRDPFSARNSNPNVTANSQQHGFEHLNIAPPALVDSDIPQPPTFNFPDSETEAEFIASIRTKLSVAKSYMLKERELGLDPDRPGMHKEPTVIQLAQPPFKIDMHAQQLVRLLLDETARLKQLAQVKQGPDEEVKEAMITYWELWTSVRANLAWQMPGKSEKERVDRMDKILAEVLEQMVEL